jgi:flavin-dependent dehydrogenase
MQTDIFDVLIIGGGITGSTTSIMLQKAGYKTIIIDKTSLDTFKQGESLHPICKANFESLNISFDDTEAIPYYGITARWGNNELNISNFIFNPYGNGLAIDRNNVEAKLINKAINTGAHVNLATSIVTINPRHNYWECKINCQNNIKTYKAGFVVIATGRNSFQRMNRCKYFYHDDLIALTLVIKTNESNHVSNLLQIESRPNGWLYANNIAGNKKVVSFLTDKDILPKSKSKISILIDQLQQSLMNADFDIINSGEQNFYLTNARTTWTEIQSGQGWVRMGDAAYTIDPLSGQGIVKNMEMSRFFLYNVKNFFEDNPEIHKQYFTFNRSNYLKYIEGGKNVFQQEQRWPGNPFWNRRSKKDGRRDIESAMNK